MKRPKDMTQDELEALPVGPCACVSTPFTAEDYANGADGRSASFGLFACPPTKTKTSSASVTEATARGRSGSSRTGIGSSNQPVFSRTGSAR